MDSEMESKIDKSCLKIGKEYTGEEFNRLTKERIFVRLTTIHEVHNYFQYRTGLNIDFNRFDPSGECKQGGLYFCDFANFTKFIEYADKFCVNMRHVKIPNDARIYVESEKFKADKFILSEPVEIFCNNKLCIYVVRQNGLLLEYVENQTREICTEAVENNAYALEHVENQTLELCTIAVKKNPFALEHVKNQTPELCTIAVKKNPFAIKHVKIQTPKLCILAVKINGCALSYIINQTPEICIEAVKNNKNSIIFVENITPEILSLYHYGL